jgi:hypothetical protein
LAIGKNSRIFATKHPRKVLCKVASPLFAEKTFKRLTAIFMPDCFVTLLISECKNINNNLDNQINI